MMNSSEKPNADRITITPVNEDTIREEMVAEEARQAQLPSRAALLSKAPSFEENTLSQQVEIVDESSKRSLKKTLLSLGVIAIVLVPAGIVIVLLTLINK